MSRPTIMLVEDDTWLAASYKRQLVSDFEVIHSASAQSAIDSIDEKKPDLIVVDYILGGPNGMTLLHELQSHEDLASIPVILLTNLGHALSHIDLTAYGVCEVLDKAILGPSELLRVARKYSGNSAV